MDELNLSHYPFQVRVLHCARRSCAATEPTPPRRPTAHVYMYVCPVFAYQEAFRSTPTIVGGEKKVLRG